MKVTQWALVWFLALSQVLNKDLKTSLAFGSSCIVFGFLVLFSKIVFISKGFPIFEDPEADDAGNNLSNERFLGWFVLLLADDLDKDFSFVSDKISDVEFETFCDFNDFSDFWII